MTEVLPQVTPNTRGLIWVTNTPDPQQAYYRDVDYLLNGLLTATLRTSPLTSAQVLVSENFGKPFYVIILVKATDQELDSYFKLLKPELTGENEIVVLDELNRFPEIQKKAPAEIRNSFRIVK